CRHVDVRSLLIEGTDRHKQFESPLVLSCLMRGEPRGKWTSIRRDTAAGVVNVHQDPGLGAGDIGPEWHNRAGISVLQRRNIVLLIGRLPTSPTAPGAVQ